MFPPERHLLAVVQSNPIGQPVCVLSNAPECAVFDLRDFEVDGFGGCGLGVLDDDANDAGGEEVADCLGGEDDAVPVCEGILVHWGEGAGHGCGCGLRRREMQWRNG